MSVYGLGMSVYRAVANYVHHGMCLFGYGTPGLGIYSHKVG